MHSARTGSRTPLMFRSSHDWKKSGDQSHGLTMDGLSAPRFSAATSSKPMAKSRMDRSFVAWVRSATQAGCPTLCAATQVAFYCSYCW
jgi:hypothetical protein